MENIDETRVLGILNDMLQKDPSAMLALLSMTYPGDAKLLEDYDVKISKKGYLEVGVLTLVNKIIENSGKRVQLEYSIDNICQLVPHKFILIDRK